MINATLILRPKGTDLRQEQRIRDLLSSCLARATLAIVLMATALGCTGYQDVTNNPQYQSGWVPGGVYRLSVARDLINLVPSSKYYFSTNGEKMAVGSCQGSIGEQVPDNPQYFSPREIVACNLPAGTRFKVEKLTRHWQMPVITAYNLTTAQGRLMDGPFQGTLIELYTISEYTNSGDERMTSPNGLCDQISPLPR